MVTPACPRSTGSCARTADTSDKRLLRLTLSDAGAQVVAEILPLAMQYEADMLAQFGDAAAFRQAIDTALAATAPD